VSVELAAVRLDELGEGVLVGVPNRLRHAKSFAGALRAPSNGCHDMAGAATGI
jgi:hypothetical protein